MEIISANSPYIINVAKFNPQGDALGTYKIYVTDDSAQTLIYSGKVSTDDRSTKYAKVDIQPILVNYFTENIGILQNYGNSFSGTASASTKMYTTFDVKVSNAAGNEDTLNLYMVYCSEPQSNAELNLTNDLICNDFLQNKYVKGTYFSLLEMHAEDPRVGMCLEITNFDGTQKQIYLDYDRGTYRYGGILPIPDTAKSFTLYIEGDPTLKDVEVIHCLPENSFILYYVNSMGAIDYLICDKKNKITLNADRHSMTKYSNILDRTSFSKVNYLNDTSVTWTLNSDIMSDNLSKQMYKVFNSPYVWVYDVDKGQMNSGIIEDASLTIKKFNTDKVFNYTFTIKSSQTFTIR